MNEERRAHLRRPYESLIKISHNSIGTVVLKTRDISDGGMFVITDSLENTIKVPPVGTVVEGQVQDGPALKMQVVRIVDEGIGLKFVE